MDHVSGRLSEALRSRSLGPTLLVGRVVPNSRLISQSADSSPRSVDVHRHDRRDLIPDSKFGANRLLEENKLWMRLNYLRFMGQLKRIADSAGYS